MAKWIWLIVIVLALIIEAMGPQIVSIWFAVGGVAAFILSLCGLDISVQIIAFVAVTVVSLIATKPIVAKLKKRTIRLPMPTDMSEWRAKSSCR